MIHCRTHPPGTRLRDLLLLLELLAAGGCSEGSAFFLEPVDCTGLPPLPPALMDASAVSESLLSDLGAGAARAVLRWDAGGSESWLLSAETTGESSRVDGDTWAVGVDLPCMPDAATHIHFNRLMSSGQAITPGAYPLSAFGFDVPEREQGNDAGDAEFDGAMIVTSSSGEELSGFMEGYARTKLKSHVTQEYLGIEVEVIAVAFREIPLYE